MVVRVTALELMKRMKMVMTRVLWRQLLLLLRLRLLQLLMMPMLISWLRHRPYLVQSHVDRTVGGSNNDGVASSGV